MTTLLLDAKGPADLPGLAGPKAFEERGSGIPHPRDSRRSRLILEPQNEPGGIIEEWPSVKLRGLSHTSWCKQLVRK